MSSNDVFRFICDQILIFLEEPDSLVRLRYEIANGEHRDARTGAISVEPECSAEYRAEGMRLVCAQPFLSARAVRGPSMSLAYVFEDDRGIVVLYTRLLDQSRVPSWLFVEIYTDVASRVTFVLPNRLSMHSRIVTIRRTGKIFDGSQKNEEEIAAYVESKFSSMGDERQFQHFPRAAIWEYLSNANEAFSADPDDYLPFSWHSRSEFELKRSVLTLIRYGAFPMHHGFRVPSSPPRSWSIRRSYRNATEYNATEFEFLYRGLNTADFSCTPYAPDGLFVTTAQAVTWRRQQIPACGERGDGHLVGIDDAGHECHFDFSVIALDTYLDIAVLKVDRRFDFDIALRSSDLEPFERVHIHSNFSHSFSVSPAYVSTIIQVAGRRIVVLNGNIMPDEIGCGIYDMDGCLCGVIQNEPFLDRSHAGFPQPERLIGHLFAIQPKDFPLDFHKKA